MTSMIARHETHLDKTDIWAALAAPLSPNDIQWRQQGKPASRDGKHFARFVAYIDSQFVQERFDSVVPGEWDSHLEPLPNVVTFDGEEDREPYAFKCRIQVLGVIREDVGQGKDYKTAATDAFKRAAVRFGIGRELYAFKPNYVQMDGDGKYAKPLEDPSVAYARRYGGLANARPTIANGSSNRSAPESSAQSQPTDTSPAPSSTEHPSTSQKSSTEAGPLSSAEESCPKCGGRMWDNRLTKRNPKAPDYKCRDRACDGVIWPPKPNNGTRTQNDDEREEVEEIPF